MILFLCLEKKPAFFSKTLNNIPKRYNSKTAIDFALSLDVDDLHLFISSHFLKKNFDKGFSFSFWKFPFVKPVIQNGPVQKKI